MIRSLLVFLALALVAAGCSSVSDHAPTSTVFLTTALPTGTATPNPTTTATPTPVPTETATPEPSPTPTPTPVVLIGAGDISYCGEAYLGDEATASILERFPEAVIFTAGDNVQGVGIRAEYRNCFDPTWGRFFDRLHPSPGNHDYMTEGGAPYYEYFGERAGPPGLGYYSYDLGEWRIVALNSNCNDIACGPDSRQAAWLREDLASSQKQCTLLYWHHPRWSSGLAGGYGSVSIFWRTAVEFGAEIVVSGHDHDYERFAPMDGDGLPSPAGVRQFVAGTGGTTLRQFGEPKPNSEIRYNESNGLLKFHLLPGSYTWEFIPTTGDFSDSGSGVCH
jgi:hypothetical protein